MVSQFIGHQIFARMSGARPSVAMRLRKAAANAAGTNTERLSMAISFRIGEWWAPLLIVQKVFLQELGSEILWWGQNIRAPLGGKIHQIPIGPNRIHVITL